MLNLLLGFIVMIILLSLSSVISKERAIVAELRLRLSYSQTENDNLRYQLGQCRLLYRGL